MITILVPGDLEIYLPLGHNYLTTAGSEIL